MKAKFARSSKEREKDALEWATNYFRKYAANLTSEGSKSLRKYWSVFFFTEMRDNQPQRLDGYANAANPILAGDLHEFAATLIERGEPLPESWRHRIAEFLRTPSKYQTTKRGPNGGDLAMRDITIAGKIREIVDKWNFP